VTVAAGILIRIKFPGNRRLVFAPCSYCFLVRLALVPAAGTAGTRACSKKMLCNLVSKAIRYPAGGNVLLGCRRGGFLGEGTAMYSLKSNNRDEKARTSDIAGDRDEEIGLANDTIESQADELRKLGHAVHASNQRTRAVIYEALAGAARFWTANRLRSDELREFYRNSGVRPPKEEAALHLQLLPTVKLMLGLEDVSRRAVRNKSQDQTRRGLQKQASDYAMALAFALSEEPDPSGIVGFFDRPALGIVEAAALYRKGRRGHRTKLAAADPFVALRSKPPIASFGLEVLALPSNSPIALIVERSDGAWVVRAAVEELPAIRRLMGSVKKPSRLNSDENALPHETADPTRAS
jgi:hypothetical protein